jgi:glycosyltransferase involved in cell wall biosynthesis
MIITQLPVLDDLPAAPTGKTGWPWTEGSEILPECMPDGSEWPRISIVTPSYNQGQFIEETIRSVLLQGYPNLEYIIIDGGSTDNTVDIIKKYEPWITYWVSEKDQGQSHALNKGFQKATGQLIGWQNSDDFYAPNTLIHIAIESNRSSEFDVMYGQTHNTDAEGTFMRAYPVSAFDLCKMLPFLNMCNQSMFFRKRIFDRNFFIDQTLRHGMDQEFLIRLAINGFRFHFMPEVLGYYRVHEHAKGSKQEDICAEEGLRLFTSIYENKLSPQELKEKALQSIYGLCIDNFGKLRLKIFRKSFRQLVKLSGFRLITRDLLFGYIASYIDPQFVKHSLKLRRSFISKNSI